MASQTGPVDGERTGGTESGDEHTGSDGETEPAATCVVCREPLAPEDPSEPGPVHRECRPALRCGISLGEPPE